MYIPSPFRHWTIHVYKNDNNKLSTISKILIATNKFKAEQNGPLKKIEVGEGASVE